MSEHAAFVRAGRIEIGHLTPLPGTAEALRVLARNVTIAQAELPVPLAIENPASLFEWPDNEFTEVQFLAELTERTGCLLLLDLANAYVNARNHGRDPYELLDQLPLDRVAYFHVAGGVERNDLLHDTHRHPMWTAIDLEREARFRLESSSSRHSPSHPSRIVSAPSEPSRSSTNTSTVVFAIAVPFDDRSPTLSGAREAHSSIDGGGRCA